MKRLALLAMLAGACGDDEGGTTPDARPPDAPPAPDAAPCPTPTGSGMEHSSGILADETWSAADSPHIVTFDIAVQGSTLTIEPCSEVRIRGGFGLEVGGTTGSAPAAIVAHGTAGRGIRFVRDAAGEPWGFLIAYDTGTIDFEEVDLEGGGDPATAPNNGGTLIAAGPGGNMGLTRNLRLIDVTVEGSGGYGVNVQTRAAFTADSAGLVIHGAASSALYVHAPALDSIPAGTYAGNGADEILVAGAGSLLDPSITFHQRGVPYRMETGFSMAPEAAGGNPSVLTIEAGVVIGFENGSPANVWSMDLGTSNGSAPGNIWPVRLIANGTAAAPIVLTSAAATPAAGDWAGLKWGGGPPDGNMMSFVRIEYAGGNSGTAAFGCGPGDNDAALIITNWRPEDAFITDSTFSDSAAGGIVSGWSTDEGGPNLLGNNTFTNIANGCNVARWADGDSSCPSPPPLCF
jgi:hypothetical protein